MAKRQAYLEKCRSEQEMVRKYQEGSKLILSDITDVVPVFVRETLLKWIGDANVSSGRRGHTEFGQEYQLYREDGKFTLECEDGALTMPRYILIFKEDD